MALNGIQANSCSTCCNTELKKKSFITTSAIGATGGYALKWLIPLAKREKVDVFLSEAEQMQEDEKVIQKEIHGIKTSSSKLKGADEFIKLYDQGQLDFSTGSKSAEKLSPELLNIYSNIVTKIKEAKFTAHEMRTNYIKSIRPATAFILLGAAAGLGYAVFSNVRAEKAKPKMDA